MAAIPAPVVRHLATPAWEINARAELGLVRRTMQDAFAVIPDAPCSWQACDVVALFDGVGGLPHGAEAAQAAATGLREAIRRATTPSQVFSHLQELVLATGGASTAVVAFLARAGGRS